MSDYGDAVVIVCLLWSISLQLRKGSVWDGSTCIQDYKNFINLLYMPVLPSPSAGWGFRPTKGAAQRPHDSGAASGNFARSSQS